MDDMNPVFAEVDRLRRRIGDRTSLRDPQFLKELADRLERSPALSERPITRALASDLRAFRPGQVLEATKEHINSRRDNDVFSLFDASYFPSLSLDYLTYETLPTDPHLAERYASNTLPVNITGASEGFGARVVVALFPENQLDGHQGPDDMIFYFIDKFVERHLRITRRMIEAVTAPDSFPLLHGMSDEQVEQASSWWVRLHEYHHRQGDMPVPQYLSAKKRKPLAGLEELRVDVSGILACEDDEKLPRQQARQAAQFILAERLLRYAVEGIPRPNYDAVASQLLFNYCESHGGLKVKDGVIHVASDIVAVLREFLGEIQRMESRIHEEPVTSVTARMLAFTNSYTDYDAQARDYRHIAFFADVKERLGV
ncbi:DUF6421 family protein [Streptomyces asoensis]|uniref:DUF6421 family protein n=1 Tax=Streptomyces asoensis TaxID=249586 RepID=UPI0036B8C454